MNIKRLLCAALALLFILPCIGCNSDKPEATTPTESDAPVVAPVGKRVALTFDDGPQYYNDNETKSIVDALAAHGFRATFFVVGNRIAGGDALPYAVEHGCEIGIHGYTHEHYYDTCTDEVYKDEIGKTLDAIHKQLPDYEVKLLRPVGGRITADRASASPYSIIMWNIDSDDWNNRFIKGDSDEATEEKVGQIVQNVMDHVEDGDIILMHDIYTNTYEAALILIEELAREGYTLVTVSELLGTPEAGKTYFSANGVN